MTFDNLNELKKIKRFAPHAGVVLRLRVPNTGSVVELSSKFGADPSEAVTLIQAAFDLGLVVEGLSFHVGSQCMNFENFVQALNISASVMQEAEARGHKIKILDIGGGFPAPYHRDVESIQVLARKINAEVDRLFSKDTDLIAEPGRFVVASAATSIAKIIGKARRRHRPGRVRDRTNPAARPGAQSRHARASRPAPGRSRSPVRNAVAASPAFWL